MKNTLNASVIQTVKKVDEEEVTRQLLEELKSFQRKIVVLDDDPTGIQTVHDVSVYTDWEVDTLREGFSEENNLFFILTNSRGMTVKETTEAHRSIAANCLTVSRETGKDFIVISRGDSTLRGHYPLETEVLRQTLEAQSDRKLDGEVIIPFFKEGGRITLGDVHYVTENERLIPAGETEFAKDKSFGYTSSHLGEWCEEKTKGAYKKEAVVSIALESLRNLEIDSIVEKLCAVEDFNKVIVNAVEDVDIKIFAIALVKAMKKGKQFIFRSAATLTKVLGGISEKPLLTHDELILEENQNGGIVIVGSHVNKTTLQLAELQSSSLPVEYIEFNQHRVLEAGGLDEEVKRVVAEVEQQIEAGKTSVVYTRRERFDLETEDKDAQLQISVQISDAVTSIVTHLKVRPNFIIAKGGITSSDVGTKALAVHKARVMGQIAPGIPVWMTGKESKFPGLPYVIFPGNVGSETTLKEVVQRLMED